ncbi:hypothetical protein FALCPG4_001523 [Fusarium falciforme]
MAIRSSSFDDIVPTGQIEPVVAVVAAVNLDCRLRTRHIGHCLFHQEVRVASKRAPNLLNQLSTLKPRGIMDSSQVSPSLDQKSSRSKPVPAGRFLATQSFITTQQV